MEKELREIIGWNCGGTYEAKVEAVKQILVLAVVLQTDTIKDLRMG